MQALVTTTRDYTLAHVEGQLYRLAKLGTLSIIPERQEVVRVAGDGTITEPDHPYERRYLLGVAVLDERLGSRRGFATCD